MADGGLPGYQADGGLPDYLLNMTKVAELRYYPTGPQLVKITTIPGIAPGASRCAHCQGNIMVCEQLRTVPGLANPLMPLPNPAYMGDKAWVPGFHCPQGIATLQPWRCIGLLGTSRCPNILYFR